MTIQGLLFAALYRECFITGERQTRAEGGSCHQRFNPGNAANCPLHAVAAMAATDSTRTRPTPGSGAAGLPEQRNNAW